jgi:nifR3 family TIM-barrel protein
MSFQWEAQKRPMLLLSPMSGYTDTVYKQLIKFVEPKCIVVTEFLSVDAIFHHAKKTLQMLEFHESEHPVIAQVFGKTVEHFVKAAKVIEDMGYDGVDINMGCPAKKVIRADHGSAMVKIENQCTAFKIVEEMSKAVKIPISCKVRLGWENSESLIPFAKNLQDNGCKCLMVHGRTTKQQYSGVADYEPIYEAKKALSIPVLGNGDITSAQVAKDKLGNLDGLLVGRGTWGNPWMMSDIQHFFDTGEVRETVLTMKEKIPVMLKHAELQVLHKGEQRGIMEMRKFLLHYFKGFPGAKDMRRNMVQVSTLEDIRLLFSGLTSFFQISEPHEC